ncbi:TPA: hypothetical protein ACIUL8_004107 [Salmonella enterica subsp. enterica serovar Reading]|nr:hypothetical protein [Salmonella enterica]EBS3610821.1 hypothetical protein [Salmonella enterica subsp. enterica serovar Poona]EBU6209381.1 hypothetical protein [Salmonella enterica subsp. enterica]EDM1743650.1 hypothetical protein [Salmonella enterica subsp. enterica serovar Muenchen]EGB1030538.1 hypothetical protein [Salmonella enterica subsp. enterica serovar Reading]EGI5703751.1 hypothetical protein [Salmonella enterica subsp. enterica serovar Chester]
MLSEYTEHVLLQQEDKRIEEETKRVILMTSCNYLFSGLFSILLTKKKHFPYTLIHARTLNEALSEQQKQSAKVILIAPESSMPSEIIMARLTIFKIEYMMRDKIIPKATCLLIYGNLTIETPDSIINSSQHFLAETLRYYLDKPRLLSPMNMNWPPLTDMQRKTLKDMLYGKDITDIAKSLNVTHQCIRRRRKKLRSKFGLRNKVMEMNFAKIIFTELPVN